MGVRFYPSKCNNRLNGKPWCPELVRGLAMVNPNYRVGLLPHTKAICDSGAFQDIDSARRLEPFAALRRQIDFEETIRMGMGTPEWHFEGIVTYDQMLGVDEQIVDGKKVKVRGNVETARPAIAETLRAAETYDHHRGLVHTETHLIFAAQGATPDQYVRECVAPLLTIMRPHDWFAFGGFCIIGKQPALKPVFYATLARVMPLLRHKRVRRAHLLGVTAPDVIQHAAAKARLYGIHLSTDSSSIEVNSTMGRVFEAGKWTKRYEKEQKYVDYHPNDLGIQNISRYYQWCETL